MEGGSGLENGSRGGGDDHPHPHHHHHHIRPSRLRKIILVASLAAGIQFGWALQLSLLTPYVQLLGVPHTWAAFIWLCGPVSGMLVQPMVGYYSDRCTSRFGRRRPFIAGGSALVAIAVFLIGFAADIGKAFGDDLHQTIKPRAVTLFVIGFWILDVANNMLQGPCRALLADLSGNSQRKTRTANNFYSFFMAVGNVLGYAAGSYTPLHKIFPFAQTEACDVYCANLKSCFILSIALLLILTVVALYFIQERPLASLYSKSGSRRIKASSIKSDGEDESDDENDGKQNESVSEPFFGEAVAALKDLPKPMRSLLVVTCLNWIAWFPFLLFDTDWMGKEVYGGEVGKGKAYDAGVRAGALGLLLNSVVLGVTSLGVEYLARAVGGVKRLWAGANFLLAACLGMTALITKMAESHRHFAPGSTDPLPPTVGIQAGALALFSVLGIPLAVSPTPYSFVFQLIT